MTDILTKADMENPRTPRQLASWYYSKYKEIRNDHVEVARARLHEGLYSYFVPEIYPLILFALWKYPQDNVLCTPRIGNQGYDATIHLIEEPEKTQNVEVTWPQDGRASKDVAHLLNSRGFHGRVGNEFDSYNREILERAIAKARDKSLIDYRTPGGSALLIVVDTECSPLDNGKRQSQLDLLAHDIRSINFRVDSIYLIATPHEGVYPVKELPTT